MELGHLSRLSVLLWGLLALPNANAQWPGYVDDSSYIQAVNISSTELFCTTDPTSSTNCTTQFLNANATGSVTIVEDAFTLSLHSTNVSNNVSLVYTVSSNDLNVANTNQSVENTNNVVETVLWLATSEQVDLNDPYNYYSACGIIIDGLTIDAIELFQSDTGSCRQILSRDCMRAMEDAAESSAYWLVANPTAGLSSNLTPPVLDYICSQIAEDVFIGIQDSSSSLSSCKPYFQSYNSSAHGIPLTSNYTDPTRRTAVVNRTRYTLLTSYAYQQFQYSSNTTVNKDLYNNLTRSVFPILTVFMSSANITRRNLPDYTDRPDSGAWLNCIRITNFSSGSLVADSLAQGTAIDEASSTETDDSTRATVLSKGAIAGIVVGAVVLLAALAGVALLVLRRRRRRVPQQHQHVAATPGGPSEKYRIPLNELMEDERKPELHGSQVYEINAADNARDLPLRSVEAVELDGRQVRRRD